MAAKQFDSVDEVAAFRDGISRYDDRVKALEHATRELEQALSDLESWWDGPLFTKVRERHDGVVVELNGFFQRMHGLTQKLQAVADREEETVRAKESTSTF